MNHKLGNIFNPEDYRYKIYDLYHKHGLGEISDDQLKEKLREYYPELVDGAISKSLQLADERNPFYALWDNALQKMTSSEYETSLSQIQMCWSDFTDYYFSMWYLRNSEELLGIESKPLNEKD